MVLSSVSQRRFRGMREGRVLLVLSPSVPSLVPVLLVPRLPHFPGEGRWLCCFPGYSKEQPNASLILRVV